MADSQTSSNEESNKRQAGTNKREESRSYEDRSQNNQRGAYIRPMDSTALAQKDADRPRAGAMEVTVEHNLEKAMKVLKRKMIKEGMFRELKARRFYEKPSERRKRKDKESVKKVRKEQARSKKNSTLLA
jgi:small subunit ribosomal protein S21